jgi:hypothetical protein
LFYQSFPLPHVFFELMSPLGTPEQQKLSVEIFARANGYIDMGAKVGWDHAQFILGRGTSLTYSNASISDCISNVKDTH